MLNQLLKNIKFILLIGRLVKTIVFTYWLVLCPNCQLPMLFDGLESTWHLFRECPEYKIAIGR